MLHTKVKHFSSWSISYMVNKICTKDIYWYTQLTSGKCKIPLIEDCIRDDTLQQRISCDTTVYSFPSSAYWYLIGGPGPSSRATSMKVAGTFSFRSCVFSATPLQGEKKIIKKKILFLALTIHFFRKITTQLITFSVAVFYHHHYAFWTKKIC